MARDPTAPGQGGSRPVAVTLPEVQELAAAWAVDLSTIAAEMYEFLAARIPAASADAEIAGLTLASCSANIEAILSMIRLGIPASATEAPVAALEHARRMAARPGGVDDTLRFYRLGHAYFWSRWSAALVEAVVDRDQLVDAMRETAAFVFDYIDSISARVAAEHIAERERRQRRAAIVRADVVRTILSGGSIELREAERALGYSLGGTHLAYICWTSGDPSVLEPASAAVGNALTPGRSLIVEDGAQALGGWVTVPVRDAVATDELARRVRALLDVLGAPVHVVLGRPRRGIEGFRASRLQADRARRVVSLADRPAPSCTAFAEVELVDLMSTDIAAARAFVAFQLGPLAGSSPAALRARQAMLITTAPGGGVAAASRLLDLHRNTVLQRLRRGEELRGRPASEDARELHAALLLASVLGDQVLGPATH